MLHKIIIAIISSNKNMNNLQLLPTTFMIAFLQFFFITIKFSFRINMFTICIAQIMIYKFAILLSNKQKEICKSEITAKFS